ncbi:MAG: hypothetical protein HGB37_03945 [Candidatus Moranbacteria bacterium]|jgi:hypothetical protein|nr:hypothetical protein [Candidatus Moranbacteria bacterium]NTW90030.1 hypothetical protein [Candidatus Moranbacteria bacterium]
MRKLIFPFLASLLIFVPGQAACADAYQLQFKYDSSKGFLTFDESTGGVIVDHAQTLSIMAYSEQPSSGSFQLAYYNAAGDELERKSFQATSASFSVETPFYPNARTLKIFRMNVVEPILTKDLSSMSLCNNDGICQFDAGENSQTCLADCGKAGQTFDAATEKLLDQNGGVISDAESSEVLLRRYPENVPDATPAASTAPASKTAPITALILGIVAFFGLIAFILFLRSRRRSA